MVSDGLLSNDVKEENNIGIKEFGKDLKEDGFESRECQNLNMDILLRKFAWYLKFKLKVNVYQFHGLHHRSISQYLYCRSQCLLGPPPCQVLLLRHHDLQQLQQCFPWIWKFKRFKQFHLHFFICVVSIFLTEYPNSWLKISLFCI